MCDTIVALANSTQDGSILFAKNSDRDPNEAHEIVIVPAANHVAGEKVKCTYIEIPQVEETYRVLLSKPFWIWGAEMGSNEFGVTIGNEAVFTREAYQKAPGLIGMDFLRLALERSRTAESAMDTIIELLERYGQGGNCGYAHPFYYYNSYLICDTREAWVLETVGREWAAEKVQDIRSISNGLTIGKKWDKASKNLVDHAIKKGWCKSNEEFDFAKCYSDPIFTHFADARGRQSCTTDLLRSKQGQLTSKEMMAVLRTHSKSPIGFFTPGKGITGVDVCMHASWGPIRKDQTAGSMVAEIRENGSLYWLTGTAAPCTSLFKPVWMDCGIPTSVKTPGAMYDEKTLFWSHEVLHREILKDYANRIKPILRDRDVVEDKFRYEAAGLISASIESRSDFSKRVFTIADEVEKEWLIKVKIIPVKNRNRFYYTRTWKKLNKIVGLPV
jgi:secernin